MYLHRSFKKIRKLAKGNSNRAPRKYDDARGFRRVQKGVQRAYFIEFGEDFEGF